MPHPFSYHIPRLILAIVASTGAIEALAAQSPAQRRELVALRDALRGGADTVALRQQEAALITTARRTPDDPMVHLRLGLISLRLGDLGVRKGYDDAGSEFQWATELRPRWPWAWYGLGLAELGVGDSEVVLVSGLQTMLGKDALTRSANAFAKSAEVDPEFVEGLVELANTALKQRINTRADVALAALRRAARTAAGRHPEVLLARGRIEREVGSPDSSAAALRALLALDSSRAELKLELARTAFLTADPAGADLWYAGLVTADSSTLAEYRAELAYVMPDSILAVFDAADAVAREVVVQEFWAARDAAELRPAGARLAEHYRRLDYARRNYRLTSTRRQFDIAERYRSGQDLFDDRGVVHVRHGQPDDRVSYVAPGVEANESWRYRRDSGDLLMHFVARQDVQDYRLVESAFDVLGFGTTVAMAETGERLGEFTHLDGIIRTRELLDPTYRRLLGAGRGSAGGLLTEERARGRQGMRVATTTDSWPLDFEEPLGAAMELLAVGADDDGPVLQVAFDLSGAGLVPVATDEGVTYRVRIRASALSPTGVPTAAVDTTHDFVMTGVLPAGAHLVGRVPMRLPPGTHVVRAAIETSGGGYVTPRDTVRVLPAGTTWPHLSDLAIGTRRVPLSWTVGRHADSLWVNPVGRFRAADTMQVHVDVAGVREMAPYQLELTVRREGGRSLLRRIFGGGGAAIRLAFAAEHPGGVARVRRELALDRLTPGKYEVEVRLKVEGGGDDVVTSRAFVVVP